MKTVIMAGGKGTRITSVNSEVPKPMLQILNNPILEYQIECLREQDYKDITIVIGYLGDVIKSYFGNGERFGVDIKYIIEDEPLGTAGSLFFLKDELIDDFVLLNGDIIFDIDMKRFYEFHKEKRSLITLFTHPNDHPFDSGIIVTNDDNQVIDWLHKEDKRNWYQNRVNAGIHFLSPGVFEILFKRDIFLNKEKVDLDRDILKPLIETARIYAYDSPEYVKDMGTPERYSSVVNDINSGKVRDRNLSKKQKAIFIDRDGTINKKVSFLKNIDDFELLDGVIDAIKKINESNYLAIVVTNQPVIARGDLTLEELKEIHNKMETMLGEQGAYLDDILFCPHHPDKGFLGERLEYKIKCDCRKPNPGLILKACEKYNIDVSKSWMIGDSIMDVEAGKNAGCNKALIDKNKVMINDFKESIFSSLLECVNEILN